MTDGQMVDEFDFAVEFRIRGCSGRCWAQDLYGGVYMSWPDFMYVDSHLMTGIESQHLALLLRGSEHLLF